MTNQKVIKNLQNKIAERKDQVKNRYAEFIYNSAIQEVVQDKIGEEQTYIDVNYLPVVGLS